MRLAFISHGRPDDPRHFSGSSSHAFNEFRRQGHAVAAFYAEPARWTLRCAEFKNRLSLKFAGKPHHFDADPWILRTRSRRVNRKIRAFAPDAVLCIGLPEAAVAISRSLPLYIWNDAMHPAFRRSYAYYRNYFSEHDSRVLGRIEARVLDRAKMTWLTSDWAANETKADFPAAAARIGMQSFGANLDDPPRTEEVEKFISVRNLTEPALLFFANEWERKGGDAAVETVKQLRARGCPAKLIVLGLANRPASVPHEPWVEWVGRLEKDKPEENARVRKYLTESAFLLLPTTADCTPIVCHEASAFGLPVLSTTVGGLSSTVDSGETGMLWPVEKFAKEASAWTASISGDRARYETMARAARRRFETRGNWAVNVRAVAAAMEADLNSLRK